MDSELSDDPARATWNSGRSVSVPDVTAQRVLRVPQWTSTPLHGLGPPSAIPYCRDGGRHPATERHAATTENISPLSCVRLTGMLAPRRVRNVSGRCDHMVGDAPRHRTSGSRDIFTCIWTEGVEQAECVAAAAWDAHTASPGGSLPRAEVVRKREDRNHALCRNFSMLLVVRARQLGTLLSPGLLCPEAWRRQFPAHWDRLCCGTVGPASVLCLGSR
ncbi:hypothetical protein TcG_01804 [Trypanosoma cruzi]|nr:hypothetical protein TcG_01804 [Trypanosoma cruzi]